MSGKLHDLVFEVLGRDLALGEEVDVTKLEPLSLGLIQILGRVDHDRDHTKLVVPAKPIDHGEAIDLGQHQVEEE